MAGKRVVVISTEPHYVKKTVWVPKLCVDVLCYLMVLVLTWKISGWKRFWVMLQGISKSCYFWMFLIKDFQPDRFLLKDKELFRAIVTELQKKYEGIVRIIASWSMKRTTFFDETLTHSIIQVTFLKNDTLLSDLRGLTLPILNYLRLSDGVW